MCHSLPVIRADEWETTLVFLYYFILFYKASSGTVHFNKSLCSYYYCCCCCITVSKSLQDCNSKMIIEGNITNFTDNSNHGNETVTHLICEKHV
jgi:hypothetical protein